MKRTFSFTASLLTVVLLVSNFGFVFANPQVDTSDVENTLYALKESFSKNVKGSEWINSVVITEFEDRPSVQMEDWYHFGHDGKVAEIYEWSTFGDNSTPPQESVFQDGVWMNLTSKQKWVASMSDLDFTFGFESKLRNVSAREDKVTKIDMSDDNIPVIQFSYETQDGALENVKVLKQNFSFEKSTGKPLRSEVYQINQNGSMELKVKTTYKINMGDTPPVDKIALMQNVANAEASGYTLIGDATARMTYTYYKTKSYSQSVTVSGLSIQSYKTLRPYTTYWNGDIYTGTPSTILQEAGANWYSFQEYCNGTYNNILISTTPDIDLGRTNWYRTTGTVFYMGGCNTEHELYVNGSHYAKYNYTIMNPSPDFAIWWPVPLS